MKKTLLFLLTVIAFSCSEKTKKDKKPVKKENQTVNTSKQENSETIKLPNLFGERIDGPANFRDTISGKKLFELNDNTLVITAPEENGWPWAGLYVKVNQEELENLTILPNTSLIDERGELIGKSFDTIRFELYSDNYALVYGRTHSGNIKPSTYPESVLSNIIKEGKTKKENHIEYITNFQFEKSEHSIIDEIEEYYIYQSELVDVSPRDRISLLYKSDFLLAVIHWRNLDLPEYETKDLIRGHSITFVKEISEPEKQTIIDKKINFYGSID
ncbi:hypothetical protein [Aquimarina intermedia]|uniref:Uncharacterized protein n=1 Tax=Aquimarina intermedia TaxID=350814 RepID=A0A5S5BTX6_9FLAO|nr:hypothetical protein [Aquimarina intermedia]TYP69652.1 hypothetical protein BD809_1272 [Aquimarina intermedia]